jgi:enoyl-CoA hydratase/carnithine racemase
MCPRKNPPNRDRRALVSVERLPNMTVLRFHGREALAGADLELLDGLWQFWEAEHLEPSPVVVVIAPPDLLSPRSLERLLGGPSATNGASAAEVSERIVREGNVTRRFVEHVRRLDSFVVGVVGGEVAFRLVAPLFACDYRIVSSDTVFVNTTQDLPRAPLNCLPWLLAKMVGGAKASQLLLDVPRLSAADAHVLGLVNHIAAPDRLEREALKVAERLSSLPRATLVSLKRAIVASSNDFQTYLQQVDTNAATGGVTLERGLRPKTKGV